MFCQFDAFHFPPKRTDFIQISSVYTCAQNSSEAHPGSVQSAMGTFIRRQSGQSLKLTIGIHLVSRFRLTVAALLPHTPSWLAQERLYLLPFTFKSAHFLCFVGRDVFWAVMVYGIYVELLSNCIFWSPLCAAKRPERSAFKTGKFDTNTSINFYQYKSLSQWHLMVLIYTQ